eukprot:m.167279 g.167279  ORF g.167279 m.167279 type:complete len:133 (-) comp14456_c1_seq1:833-1231(-)
MDGFVASIVALIHGIVASVVSENCADVLISDFNLGDSQCVKLAISKALGYGVVLGATIVKVPQIVKLVRAKSAEGVSLNAHIIELTVYTVNFAKNYRMQLPLRYLIKPNGQDRLDSAKGTRSYGDACSYNQT